jgi:hypothetical protein
MAARRDRERRRPPTEGRYRFGTPEPALEPDETLLADNGQATEAVETPPKRTRTVKTDAPGAVTRAGARTAALPFSAYKAEYAYVFGDLRRVALVIGSLLVILLVLFFVLPR